MPEQPPPHPAHPEMHCQLGRHLVTQTSKLGRHDRPVDRAHLLFYENGLLYDPIGRWKEKDGKPKIPWLFKPVVLIFYELSNPDKWTRPTTMPWKGIDVRDGYHLVDDEGRGETIKYLTISGNGESIKLDERLWNIEEVKRAVLRQLSIYLLQQSGDAAGCTSGD